MELECVHCLTVDVSFIHNSSHQTDKKTTNRNHLIEKYNSTLHDKLYQCQSQPIKSLRFCFSCVADKDMRIYNIYDVWTITPTYRHL